MSAKDAMKAQMDALMGAFRDEVPKAEDPNGPPRWQGETVCHKFLVGLCPNDLFGMCHKCARVSMACMHACLRARKFMPYLHIFLCFAPYHQSIPSLTSANAARCTTSG